MNLASIAIRGSSGLQPEVETFISASYANITDSGIITDLNNLVGSLKTNGLWTMQKAVYPIVGGNATAHSYNLKDPTLYQITWSGTLTHNANGVTGGGGYGLTGLVPSSVLSLNNTHISAYIRVNGTAGSKYEIGVKGSVGNYRLGLQVTGVQFWTYMNDDAPLNSTPGAAGYYIGSRPNSSGGRNFRNGTRIGGTTTGTAGLPNAQVALLATNDNGSILGNSVANLAFVTIGDAFASDAAAGTMYTIVQAFQTARGRNV